MESFVHSDDHGAIEALIHRQFASLSWAPGKLADWEGFAADFFPQASLYPSARPAKRQTVHAFVERIRRLAETTLVSFEETVLGTEIRVFSNVAVAFAAYEITENDVEVNRSVEALLLIKDKVHGGSYPRPGTRPAKPSQFPRISSVARLKGDSRQDL